MIEIRINRTGDYNQIKVTGHANSAEYGYDVVCAAVSTMIKTFMDFANREMICIKWIMEPGNTDIVVMDPAGLHRELLRYIFSSLEWIAEEYDEFVRIEHGEIINR